MSLCPDCSKAISEDALSCPACGANFADTATPTKLQPDKPAKKPIVRLISTSTSKENNHERFVAGEILAGRYRVISLLGKGGMGEVYKAEDLELNQTVALKFLSADFAKDKAALERFRGEVRTARQVAHPNVCRVFDIGEINGSYYLSMEFIDGDDLSSLLRRIGRLPSDKAVEISRQICLGLHAIHNAGILHRDLKPANIIIDSKGKARITDFGIAALEEDLKGTESRIGTPAYMSPEQITGNEVTNKSDIYSLGLVLYEIFTGKQALQFDSIPELIRKHQTETPTNPSEILREINPLAEKTILQCLEKDPTDRPKNALQVALMLPGGNPLEAAIAAGETPSPEMVAAAPKKGALKPHVALGLFAGMIVTFAFLVYFSYPVRKHSWLPLEKSPEVLAERARAISQKLGYTNTPVDTAYGFDQDSAYTLYIAQNEKTEPPDSWVNSPNRLERIKTGQPDEIYFWYRQSPSYFNRFGAEYVDFVNPPRSETSGMVSMKLDVRGRLLSMVAVPPQSEQGNQPKSPTDWAAVFAEAGLDIRNYKETEPKWTPYTHSDERAAWEGVHVDHPEIPVRIEAAAYRGKPVYFVTIMPWDLPYREMSNIPLTSSVKAGVAILVTAFIGLMIAGVFVARYNLKSGRADTKGAFRLLVYTFTLALISGLLTVHYSMNLFVLSGILYVIKFALLIAAGVWVSYVAIEPFVRRYWPHLGVSWSRLMAGDFRDPLVGRDILIGAFLGLLHTLFIYSGYYLRLWSTGIAAPIPGSNPDPLIGSRWIVSSFLYAFFYPILWITLWLLLVVILTVIFRRRWLAVSVLWFLNFLVTGLFFFANEPLVVWLVPVLTVTVSIVCLMRFGMLAVFAYGVFQQLSLIFPLTTDVSAWYSTSTLFSVAVIIGLGFYGFHTSIAGQKIFQGKWMVSEFK